MASFQERRRQRAETEQLGEDAISSTTEREAPGRPLRKSGRVAAVLVLEAIALGIALVAPVTPSKTGSTWSPAEIFAPDPSYLQKVVASFITVNVMMLFIGILVWVMVKLGAGD